MTKNNTNESAARPQDINKKPWYKSAVLPWALIAVAVLYMGGIATGWMLRTDVNAKIDAEVVSKFEQLKK